MKSIWNQTCQIPRRNHLAGNLDTEVAIIGGGLAGILTAFYLVQEGKQVIVLEASATGSGQTGHTSAKITSQHHLIYQKLLTDYGRTAAIQYAHSNEEAIREYERLIAARHISCNFQNAPAFLYTLQQPNAIHLETMAARQAGIPAFEVVDTELPFAVKRAVCFPQQARFNPLLFLEGLSAAVTVFEHTPALSVRGHTITTPYGQVKAKKIVFACHYPFPVIPGYYFLRMYQDQSYILALSRTPGLKGMYLSIDSDGLSFRQEKSWLLLGGRSHRTGCSVPDPYHSLASSAHYLFPDAKVHCQWSAQDCMTVDSLPFIGRFSRRTPDWYIATGFGKWGMTLSMVSARLLADLICGKTSPYETLYSPMRFRLRPSVSRLATHMIKSSIGFMKSLEPGVMRCPHMGCRLSWNPADSTWDCPCHGSRFNHQGQLITGPAQKSCSRHKLIP